jgi:uncharacterized protein
MIARRSHQMGRSPAACGALLASALLGCGDSGGVTERVTPNAPAGASTATNQGTIVPAMPTSTASPSQATPAAGTAGSGGGTAATADPPFTKEATLAAIASCAGERFKDFQSKASALKTAADAWTAAPADMAAVEGMRAAWKTAMASWQEAELFRIGPAAAMFSGGPTIPGGKNLRNEIYAFPLRNTCTIDQHLANEGYKMFPTVASDARGLGGIEYLAFNVGTAHTCTGNAATSIDSTWTGLGAMLSQRRAAYAAAAAGDIVTRANQLVMEWDPAFQTALSSASAPLMGQQAALQAISDAIFYVDKELKDFKLGRPLEITMDCMMPAAGVLCNADGVESRIAGVSIENIRTNLRAFRRIFQGCGDGGAGLGLDAWLIGSGLTDLAMRMTTALDAAQAAADAFPPLESTLMSDKAMVMNLHASIKALTDIMKTDFLSMLELSPPPAMTPAPAAPPAAPSAGTSGGAAGAAGPTEPMMPAGGFFDGD